MAKGDVVNGVSSIANGADLDYQPAVGVEALIKSVFLSNSNYGTTFNIGAFAYGIYNGSLHAHSKVQSPAFETNQRLGEHRTARVSVLVNNTNYLRIHNSSGGTAEAGYSGIQTK